MGGSPSVQLSHPVGIRQNSADNATPNQGGVSSGRLRTSQVSGATNAFFALPDDILITILQCWLENDARRWLKALSALDIACCSSKHRQLLVSLFAAVTIPHNMSTDEHLTHEHNCTGMYIDDPSYLNWLSSRRVQVEFLGLRGDHEWEHTLPGIKHITGKDVQVLSFLCALQHCPNVQSIFMAPSDNQPTLAWSALSQPDLNLDNLEYLRAFDQWSTHPEELPFRNEFRNTLLKATNLKVFAGYNITLTPDLVDALCGCAKLEVVMGYGIQSIDTIKLLAACKSLHTLSVLDFNHNSVPSVLQDAGQGRLKRFVNPSKYSTNSLATLLDVMEQHEWLDELRIARYSFCRSTKALMMDIKSLQGITNLSAAQVERIATCMPTIITLSICVNAVAHGHESLVAVCELICGTVEHLTIEVTRKEAFPVDDTIVAVASACPLLKHVVIFGVLTDISLVHLATNCRNLQSFTLTCTRRHLPDLQPITDMGMEALIGGCPELVEISLNGAFKMTYRTLHAIATRGRPFRSLIVMGSAGYIGKEEIAQFHVLAKQRQLLPMPVIKVKAPARKKPTVHI